MPRDAIYEGERELRTYVTLYYASDALVNKAESEVKGRYYTSMSALILSAFTFEAYLNHLGAKKLKYWADIESARVMGKYAILCSHYNLSPDQSRRPYQTLKKLIDFRNALAHGKSRKLPVKKKISPEDELKDHSRKALWEQYCTSDNAKKARDDVSRVIRELHSAAGLGKNPFEHGLTRFSIKLVPDEG